MNSMMLGLVLVSFFTGEMMINSCQNRRVEIFETWVYWFSKGASASSKKALKVTKMNVFTPSFVVPGLGFFSVSNSNTITTRMKGEEADGGQQIQNTATVEFLCNKHELGLCLKRFLKTYLSKTRKQKAQAPRKQKVQAQVKPFWHRRISK